MSVFATNFEEDVSAVAKFVTKIQKIYRRDCSAASREDKKREMELDDVLNDLHTHVATMREAFNSQIDTLQTELTRTRKKVVTTVNTWKERYDRLQIRWNALMKSMKRLQHQKEELRNERDALLCEHQKSFRKLTMTRNPSNAEKHAVREFFNQLANEILISIKIALKAENATIWVYDYPTDHLVSIAIYPNRDQIRVPSNKGFVGEVFQKGRALNILHCYDDDRFFKGVDKKTGIKTNRMLAYPLISKETGTTIGCLQLINREDGGVFTVEDEARMSQFVFIVSRLFDCVQDFFDFGSGGGSVGFGGQGEVTESQTSSLINVKRVGEDEESHARSDKIGFLQKHGALIPKYIEDFIHNLHRGWRMAVDEASRYQNKIAQLKGEKDDQDNEIREMRKQLEKKRLLVESLNKTILAFSRESLLQNANVLANGGVNSPKKDIELKLQISKMKHLHHTMKSMDDDKGISMNSPSNNVSLPPIKSPNNRSYKKTPVKTNRNGAHEYSMSRHQPVSSHLSQSIFYHEIYEKSPVPSLLLTSNYYICGCNKAICKELNYRRSDLLGLMFQTILFKIDVDMLPRLLHFEYVDGISLKKHPGQRISKSVQQNAFSPTSTFSPLSPTSQQQQKKQFIVKMDIQIGIIGKTGQSFKLSKPSRIVQAPVYILAFKKSSTRQTG